MSAASAQQRLVHTSVKQTTSATPLAMRSLLRLPAIQQLPDELQEPFAQSCELLKLGHKQVLEDANAPALGAYCVVSGAVRMYALNSDDKRVLVSIMPPNYWFGVAPMCDGGLSTFESVASGVTEVLRLPKAAFTTLLGKNSSMQRLCLDWLSFKLRTFSMRVANSATLPLDQRLARQIVQLMEGWGVRAGRAVRIELKVSHEDMAEMLGATRQRIHQIMHVWENDKVVGRDGRYITVLDTSALMRLAGVLR